MRLIKGLIFLVCLLVAMPLHAQVKLYRYFDKSSGEERGVSYSDKDGNPRNNSEWDYEEISEDKKEFYIKKQEQEIKSKPRTKSDLEKRVEVIEKKLSI